jgi:hypothetical protein
MFSQDEAMIPPLSFFALDVLYLNIIRLDSADHFIRCHPEPGEGSAFLFNGITPKSSAKPIKADSSSQCSSE